FAVYLALALVSLLLISQITVLCFQSHDTTGQVLGRLDDGSMSSEVEVLLYTKIPIFGFHCRADNSSAGRGSRVERERRSRNMRSCTNAINLECLIQCVGKEIVWW
ncbi:hypothetical protein J3R83DRAFT_4844, partial [Lanmaoa asiatica]